MRVSGMREGDIAVFDRRETIFRGISGGEGTMAIGRVCILGIGQIPTEGSATILCLFDMLCERELDCVMARIEPAGMILSASAISPRLLELIIYRHIPYMIIKNSLPCEYCGRVAMLDTQRDIIVIDPDVETICDYSKRALPIAPLQQRTVCLPSEVLLFEENGGGIFVDADTMALSGDIYPQLMEVVESFCGMPVAVSLRVPIAEREREAFGNLVEGIYRAAVYGSFSLYLRGYDSEMTLKSALADMHRVFCRLEEEGREFNGYLRRGIVIESPVWLLRPSPFLKADAVCFDIDSITAHLMGCETCELCGRALEKNALIRIWEHYFSRFATECRRIAVLKNTDRDFFHAWRVLSGAGEIYGITGDCKAENT